MQYPLEVLSVTNDRQCLSLPTNESAVNNQRTTTINTLVYLKTTQLLVFTNGMKNKHSIKRKSDFLNYIHVQRPGRRDAGHHNFNYTKGGE